MSFAKLYEEKVKQLRTQKGSVIKRSKYGVGKLIGGFLYVHKDYVPAEFKDQVADRLAHAAQFIESHLEGNYNIIKISTKDSAVTFFNCTEFDSVHEPVAGSYVAVNDNGDPKTGKTGSIYHHKFLFVKDDYKGFDVDAEFERSKLWLTLDDIDFARIGNKKTWDEQYIPRINELLAKN